MAPKRIKKLKDVFITLVILDVMALIGSIIGIVNCYVEVGRTDPLPWCLLMSWANNKWRYDMPRRLDDFGMLEWC